MDKGTEHAYKWAKGQNYQSVAADYARALAIEIDRLSAENARLRAELEAANGDLWLIAIGKEPCDVCAHKGKDAKESPCVTCYGSDFEWRGLVPDNTPDAETGAHETGGGKG